RTTAQCLSHPPHPPFHHPPPQRTPFRAAEMPPPRRYPAQLGESLDRPQSPVALDRPEWPERTERPEPTERPERAEKPAQSSIIAAELGEMGPPPRRDFEVVHKPTRRRTTPNFQVERRPLPRRGQ